jgi:beta-lactamase class A
LSSNIGTVQSAFREEGSVVQVLEVTDKLERLERELRGTLGVCALSLRGEGEPIRHREREQFPAASTIKVFVLQALLEQAQTEALSLSDELVLSADEQVTGSGVLKELTAGRTYTLRDLATLMIIISDNTATNLLIERLGVDTINQTCARHGWADTWLAGKLQKGLTRSSYTCPRDLADYFARLWRGQLLTAELTSTAKGIYERQQLTDQLGREIGHDPYSSETGESELVIASKGGSLRGVRNDAGVISGTHGSYVLAVMSKDCPDERFYPENLGSRVIRLVSRTVFEAYSRREAAS